MNVEMIPLRQSRQAPNEVCPSHGLEAELGQRSWLPLHEAELLADIAGMVGQDWVACWNSKNVAGRSSVRCAAACAEVIRDEA